MRCVADRRKPLPAAALVAALSMVPLLAPVRAEAPSPGREPDLQAARAWWPPLTHVYTPIGWKNHLFRFNVFYNGMIMANPQPEPDIKALDPWKDLGVQLTILPSEKGQDPGRWQAGTYQMTGDSSRRWGFQGLLNGPTPVIWTEWRQSYRSAIGTVVRQEAFAHMAGGGEIVTGTEPLFAWVRMSVKTVNPVMKPAPCGILVKINKPHLFPEMYEGRHCALRTTDARYPRELKLERMGESSRPGGLVVEPDGKIRIGILPGRASEMTLAAQRGSHEQDIHLHVVIPAEEGSYVDLLVPAIPMARDVFLAEMETGRQRALEEANAYWSMQPDTLARIDTPEPYINELIRRNAQYAQIIAQKMPDSGHYANLTGSLVYARMWATPTTMFDTLLLDALGYHQEVARYLEILKATQGTAKPPGPAYEKHPGYFGSPRSLVSCDWLSDHGAVLHAACQHALVTDDKAFIEAWLPAILRGCAFIRDARAKTGHVGVPGVLPGAVADDRNIPTQSVWNVGWNYLGLTSAVRLLERLNHPQAEVFSREAVEYRDTFVRALHEKTQQMPTWKDAAGQVYPIVAPSLSEGADFAHPFYLDTGPLFLVPAGLLRADDPLMRSTLNFFRQGPNHLAFDLHGHHEQPAVLVHEISSCEPAFSWNLFHSHQLGDRCRYLEGMYSLLTGGHSQQTYIACETRGGITGIPGHIGIYAVRLAAVDDLFEPDTLHLLRMVPLAWLKEDRPTVFESVPTVFGPVSVRFQLRDAGKSLAVEFTPRFHHPPRRVMLHVPPLNRLSSVVVNGRTIPVGSGTTIEVK